VSRNALRVPGVLHNVLTYLLLAAGYAFASAVQPGPFLAYLISQSLTHGWRRTLPAAFAPLLSDGPVIVTVLFVLTRLPPEMLIYLRLAGGLFLLYLAYGAFRSWRVFSTGAPPPAAPRSQTVLRAALVNLLNPGPWLGWSLVMGPLLLRAWREAPAHGAAMLAGFYSTMVLSLVGIIIVFGVARRFGPRLTRGLIGVSALALLGFAVWQLWMGVAALQGA
jgi:threonine/homoserine/homoserine lactone efflux protein